MGCITALKRWLVRAHILPPFTEETIKAAETVNLEVERAKTISTLDAQTKTFYAQSAEIEAKVDTEKTDIDHVMDHLKRVTAHAADARSILENIIARRQQQDRRRYYQP